MLIKSLVRDVQSFPNAEKPYGILTIETEQPLEVHQVRLFSNSMNDGTYARLSNLKGQVALLPFSIDNYKGKTQFQIPYGAEIPSPASKPAKAVSS